MSNSSSHCSKPIEELCREAGCSTASRHSWKAKYGDATVLETRRLRQLEREHQRLLKLVGQRRLELEGMQEILAHKR